MTSKFCDNCKKNADTKEYFFMDGKKLWSRHWCDKCMIEWKEAGNKLGDSLDELITKRQQTMGERLVECYKIFLIKVLSIKRLIETKVNKWILPQ